MRRAASRSFRKIQSLIAVVILGACLLSLLLAHDSTRESITRLHRQINWDFSHPDVKDAIRDDGRTVDGTPTILPTNMSYVTSTEDYRIHFRDWFDLRPPVHPFKPTRAHPLVSEYVISNNDVCRNQSVDILIYFHSAWNNFQQRRLLRETWANTRVFKNISVRTVFFLGRPSDKSQQIHVVNENVAHGDIVQGNFLDSFKNLSLKAMLALRWMNDHCVHARYIVKADDDIFINIFKLVEDFIPKIATKEFSVMCHFKPGGTSQIIRNSKSKWYIPPEVFRGEKFLPPFCSGYVAVFTTDSVPYLYETSYRAPNIPVDDVYIFGLLSKMSKRPLTFMDVKQNFTLSSKVALKQYQDGGPLTFVAASSWDKGSLEQFWTATLKTLSPWAKQRSTFVDIIPSGNLTSP